MAGITQLVHQLERNSSDACMVFEGGDSRLCSFSLPWKSPRHVFITSLTFLDEKVTLNCWKCSEYNTCPGILATGLSWSPWHVFITSLTFLDEKVTLNCWKCSEYNTCPGILATGLSFQPYKKTKVLPVPFRSVSMYLYKELWITPQQMPPRTSDLSKRHQLWVIHHKFTKVNIPSRFYSSYTRKWRIENGTELRTRRPRFSFQESHQQAL